MNFESTIRFLVNRDVPRAGQSRQGKEFLKNTYCQATNRPSTCHSLSSSCLACPDCRSWPDRRKEPGEASTQVSGRCGCRLTCSPHRSRSSGASPGSSRRVQRGTMHGPDGVARAAEALRRRFCKVILHGHSLYLSFGISVGALGTRGVMTIRNRSRNRIFRHFLFQFQF